VIRSHLGEAPHTIALDRLQADLLVNEAEARTEAAGRIRESDLWTRSSI